MPTDKKRLNLTLSKDLDRALARVAERDDVPQATKAVELIKLALELEEDQRWTNIVLERQKNNPKYIAHEEVWAHIK